MSNVFFTSDLHLGHKNIIEYSKCPFKDVEEMDEMLVKNWNDVVRPGDRVYLLGDFYLGRADDEGLAAAGFAKRLMGQKYMIWGNHDKRIRRSKAFQAFQDEFIWCKDLDQIEVDSQKIILCHFAMLTWNQSHRGSWMLHGHSHGSLPDDPCALRLDVGVDADWDYAPASFEQVQERMSKKTWKAIDHHDKRDL